MVEGGDVFAAHGGAVEGAPTGVAGLTRDDIREGDADGADEVVEEGLAGPELEG